MAVAPSPWVEVLGRRVGSVLASVPGQTQEPAGGPPSYGRPDALTPPWLLLPSWLEQAWATEGPQSLPDGELAELLWGQYALFLYIRIQDDLLDKERADLGLLFVADRFLLESLESFQRFPALNGQFWAFYRKCLRETVDGILEVRRLENTPGGFTVERLGLHARVSAIFKLGAAAVCRLHGRDGEMAWLSDFVDRLAILGQICDDFRDLAQDLEVGRFTWVANALLGGRVGDPIVPEEWAGRLRDGFMRPDWEEPVLAELRRLARLAAEGVPDSAPPAVHDLVRELRIRPDALEQGMHEARVRWVFGEVLATDP